MTTPERFRKPSSLQLVDLSPHGIVVKFLLLCSLPLATAQRGSLSSPPPSVDQFTFAQKFNPSMATIMVALVSAFFLIGFCSVYFRQCAERRFREGHFNQTAAAIAGIGRRSWRMRPGLDTAVIEAYFPTFLYSAIKGLKIGKGTLECAVCLNEFEDDETLRLIPNCSHVFHPGCIDAWLASHTTCPVCRANLVPKPGDMSSDSVHMFEQDDNTVEPEERFDVNADAQSHVAIHVGDDDHQARDPPQIQSPNVNLSNPTHQSRPPRSWSSGWRLNKLFPRSHSTGHSLVQPNENCERFTLRLPEEVRSQLLSTHLKRTKSCVTFSRVRSSRKGYRNRNGSGWLNQEGQPNVFTRNRSVGSLKERVGNEEEAGSPSQHVLRSVRSLKSPLDCFFPGSDYKNSNNDHRSGEQSIDPLIPDAQAQLPRSAGVSDLEK